MFTPWKDSTILQKKITSTIIFFGGVNICFVRTDICSNAETVRGERSAQSIAQNEPEETGEIMTSKTL